MMHRNRRAFIATAYLTPASVAFYRFCTSSEPTPSPVSRWASDPSGGFFPAKGSRCRKTTTGTESRSAPLNHPRLTLKGVLAMLASKNQRLYPRRALAAPVLVFLESIRRWQTSPKLVPCRVRMRVGPVLQMPCSAALVTTETSSVSSVRLHAERRTADLASKCNHALFYPIMSKKSTPFTGSGSSGMAAVNGGFGFIGMEKEMDYFAIAQSRIRHSKGETGLFAED